MLGNLVEIWSCEAADAVGVNPAGLLNGVALANGGVTTVADAGLGFTDHVYDLYDGAGTTNGLSTGTGAAASALTDKIAAVGPESYDHDGFTVVCWVKMVSANDQAQVVGMGEFGRTTPEHARVAQRSTSAYFRASNSGVTSSGNTSNIYFTDHADDYQDNNAQGNGAATSGQNPPYYGGLWTLMEFSIRKVGSDYYLDLRTRDADGGAMHSRAFYSDVGVMTYDKLLTAGLSDGGGMMMPDEVWFGRHPDVAVAAGNARWAQAMVFTQALTDAEREFLWNDGRGRKAAEVLMYRNVANTPTTVGSPSLSRPVHAVCSLSGAYLLGTGYSTDPADNPQGYRGEVLGTGSTPYRLDPTKVHDFIVLAAEQSAAFASELWVNRVAGLTPYNGDVNGFPLDFNRFWSLEYGYSDALIAELFQAVLEAANDVRAFMPVNLYQGNNRWSWTGTTTASGQPGTGISTLTAGDALGSAASLAAWRDATEVGRDVWAMHKFGGFKRVGFDTSATFQTGTIAATVWDQLVLGTGNAAVYDGGLVGTLGSRANIITEAWPYTEAAGYVDHAGMSVVIIEETYQDQYVDDSTPGRMDATDLADIIRWRQNTEPAFDAVGFLNQIIADNAAGAAAQSYPNGRPYSSRFIPMVNATTSPLALSIYTSYAQGDATVVAGKRGRAAVRLRDVRAVAR